MKINKAEFFAGLGILVVTIVLGLAFLSSESLVAKLFIGLAIGYTLARACFGFAGSVNRAFATGSTKLMRVLMVTFFITSTVVSAMTYADPSLYSLSIYPINIGLAVGAGMFGIGMAFASCCASGVLTDLVEIPVRSLIVLVFFCIGVALGFPLQSTAPWVTDTLIGGTTYENGVFIPDMFKFDGYNGHLGTVIFVGLLCFIVIALSYVYESKRRKAGTYKEIPAEKAQDDAIIESIKDADTDYKVFSAKTFNRLFVKPWSLATGGVAMAIIFIYMMAKTGSGWGVTTDFGRAALHVLYLFGVSAESLSEFSHRSVESISTPFYESGSSIQNFAILIGALVATLMAGKFKKNLELTFKLSFKDVSLSVLAGLLMGIGTRLANGCNAGGLFTPISHLSLSGWFFLVFMVLGGIVGNMIKARVNK